MKDVTKGFLIGVAILAVFGAGVFTGEQIPQKLTEERCLTGDFLILNQEYGSLVKLGEQQLCGKDLRWSAMYGPSFEEWKKDIEKKPKAFGGK